MNEVSYVLNEDGITFYVNGIIMFDCPRERMAHDPEKGIMALRMLEEFWKKRVKDLKGGETI